MGRIWRSVGIGELVVESFSQVFGFFAHLPGNQFVPFFGTLGFRFRSTEYLPDPIDGQGQAAGLRVGLKLDQRHSLQAADDRVQGLDLVGQVARQLSEALETLQTGAADQTANGIGVACAVMGTKHLRPLFRPASAA